MKPTIHFILPGGGVKGCFQAGFLHHLFTYFPNKFNLYQVDGCSVGALNGYALCGENIEQLKTIWNKIDPYIEENLKYKKKNLFIIK